MLINIIFHCQESKVVPSALEQIGELKLLHLPRALARGVDVLMLDLDVGFLDDPLKVLSFVRGRPKGVDIFVQVMSVVWSLSCC
jgi:hypothetical protein